jgi:hypothetical protein
MLDEVIPITQGALKDVLQQLKSRPTHEQQWPDTYKQGLVKGKARVQQLEAIRGDRYTLADILAADPKIKAWYDRIA